MSTELFFDAMELQTEPRFVVGIDLGTTNCAVAFVDSEAASREPQVFMVPQLVDWQTVENRSTLPSFYYQWTEHEASQLKTLPPASIGIHSHCVGGLARDRGLQSPGRQIASAKSWLCHNGVDRTASILPWHGEADVERLSPVVASSHYLKHIRMAWDRAHPQHPLESCEVIITLPASFDEVARELTIEAARLAGLTRIVLIEEPQAAFYAWLSRHESEWNKKIRSGQTVLICDIGGGTTDFTLVRVRDDHAIESEMLRKGKGESDHANPLSRELLEEEKRRYGLHRVAVGQHLMLGGDNLDLALAKAVEPLFFSDLSSIPQNQLGHPEFESLRQQCRVAKEALLRSEPPKHYSIAIAGRGSQLIGNVRSVEVPLELAQQTLLEGFFPNVALDAIPDESEGGLFEFGLPYAADPAITRHLAKFLWGHRWDGRPDEQKQLISDQVAARPDWILFNGGVLESPQIRQRLLAQLNLWFGNTESEVGSWRIGELEARQLDLAVAIGAAYFGMVRRGQGVRIDARLARAYYLQVNEDPPKAMCIMPGDATPLDRFLLSEHPFELEIGRPIQFPIYVSSTNLVHRIGEIVSIDLEHMRPLPPIQTVLESTRHKRSAVVPIVLESLLTEIGTLELSLATSISTSGGQSGSDATSIRWRLAFDLRSSVETDRSAHQGILEQSGIVESELIDKAASTISAAFLPEAPKDAAKDLMKNLAHELGLSRNAWKPSLLRSMWQTLIDLDPQQKRSSSFETRWLNLLGFCLRPGYGFAADDWRVAVTWRAVHGKLKHPSSAVEAMVLWRRIAGGFTVGQQRALYQEVQTRVRGLLESNARNMPSIQESMELLRLVGSLELLASRDKKLLGNLAIDAIHRNKLIALRDSVLWMLGRLGARMPVYAPMNDVLPPDVISDWVHRLCKESQPQPAHHLALMQLTRKTGDRYRDVSIPVRELSLKTLEQWKAPESYLRVVRDVAKLDMSEKEMIVGESLPLGIRLRG